jgi:hypothetical protein
VTVAWADAVTKRPDGTGRLGDMIRGVGHGFIIETPIGPDLYWAKGTAEGETVTTVLLTRDRDEASFWRTYDDALEWAEENLVTRPRRRWSVVRTSWPKR